VAQTNGVFELRLKSGGGQEGVWTIDMKKDGRVYAGAAKPKADVTLLMDDGVFMQMAAGEVRAASLVGSGAKLTQCSWTGRRRTSAASSRPRGT
jgi:putative sterol carrier protein